MLPAVVDDHLIQPVFFAGPYFSSTGHLKIPPNMKYRYDTMIIGCDHGTTDAILRFHGCCGRALYSILFRVYFAVLVLVRKGHERFPRVISAKLNFIAQNGGDFRFGFYGLGVISSSTGVVNGSMDGQYRPEGFYKRMGRIEHKLKMCLISASDMCNCLFLNILTWP